MRWAWVRRRWTRRLTAVAAAAGLMGSGAVMTAGAARAATPPPSPSPGALDRATNYRLVASDGGIFSYGGASFNGSAGGLRLVAPIVGMAADGDGGGYWMVAADGGIFNYGDAPFEGAAAAHALSAPVVGMAPTPDGKGYWEVGADGAVYPFGDAVSYGSMAGTRLTKPVVGMAATPDGRGYWLAASDGGIFAFGDAGFYGSAGNLKLVKPIVGMTAAPDGRGYWMVAADGGIFNYGDAKFAGSAGNLKLAKPVVGMAATPTGKGYWMVAADGGIFNYGDAPFLGSAGNLKLVKPVVGLAPGPSTTGSPTYDACPGSGAQLPDEQASLAEPITVPAATPEPLTGAAAGFNPKPGDVPAGFVGTIYRPVDAPADPRPAIVLLHGRAGDQCQVAWLARYLAGAGDVTLTLTSPAPADFYSGYGVAIDAGRSAVDLLTSPLENPFSALTDPTDIGVAGWSQGSIVASLIQGLPDMGAIRAIAALDNLRGSLEGDSGAPQTFCVPPTEAVLTPRVPALGFASDAPCDVEPNDTSADLKQSGWAVWHDAGVPAVELPLAGYTHFDFAAGAPVADLTPVGELTRQWFGAWLDGPAGSPDNDALAAVTSCPPTGVLGPKDLSATYQAAVYLPSLGLDSATWTTDLTDRCAPTTP